MRPEEILRSSKQTSLLLQDSFPSGSDGASEYTNTSFIVNIRRYLASKGQEIRLPGGSSCWSVELRDGIELYIYEENVTKENTVCDQCRIIGWGTHPVCSKKYHFVIPAETGPDSLDDPTSLAAITQACRLGKHHASRISLPTKVISETAEHHASIYNADPTIYDSTKHRLHGVIHGNGYGHLLRINGMYGGSRGITGLQIMSLWDELCDMLQAKDVTVEDVSAKNGMELRISYFLGYGQTWYGLFGYGFGRGPYNITEKRWQDAGTYVSSTLLTHLLHDFEGVEEHVPEIIRRYSLPVRGAAVVRDFGALLYRLLYLQLNPDQAGPFFDTKCIQEAEEVVSGQGSSATKTKKLGPIQKKRKKGIRFSPAPQKKRDSVAVSKAPTVSVPQIGKTLRDLQVDRSLPPYSIEDVEVHSELEILLRGEIVDAVVVAMPVNRGRMHRLRMMDGKERKVDLETTPWRLKGTLAPMTGSDEGTLRLLEKKEESKLESIKNSRNNSANPAVLKYKANLSRDDFVERARQLCRALKSLIPNSRAIIGQSKTRADMEAAFSNLVGGAGPVATCKNSWWEFLPILMRWIQGLLEIQEGDAAKCITLVDNTVEIDRECLHQMGMFPEAWNPPLSMETLKEDNFHFRSKNPNFTYGEAVKESNANYTRNTRSRSAALSSAGTKLDPCHDGGTSRDHTEDIEKCVRDSINATLDSLWNSAISPSDDDETARVSRPWHSLDPGADVADPRDLDLIRNQITRDLHYLFMCTLKIYLPEVAKIAAKNAAACLQAKFTHKVLKARQLSKEVRVLRDTKLFLKHYHPYLVPVEDKKNQKSTISVWTRIVMPRSLNEKSMSATRFGRKCLPIAPPPEIITVKITATIREYLDQVTKHFRELYHMFSKFKAVGVVLPEKFGNKGKGIQSTFLHENIQLRTLLGNSKANLDFEVVGEGYTLDNVWLHAGGPEDWVVNCPCGTRDDDGEAMVACDVCETWMHTRCVNVPDGTHTWSCEACQRKQNAKYLS